MFRLMLLTLRYNKSMWPFSDIPEDNIDCDFCTSLFSYPPSQHPNLCCSAGFSDYERVKWQLDNI